MRPCALLYAHEARLGAPTCNEATHGPRERCDVVDGPHGGENESLMRVFTSAVCGSVSLGEAVRPSGAGAAAGSCRSLDALHRQINFPNRERLALPRKRG